LRENLQARKDKKFHFKNSLKSVSKYLARSVSWALHVGQVEHSPREQCLHLESHEKHQSVLDLSGHLQKRKQVNILRAKNK
jgi:hypothetical protein